jgi:hypothetical protein
MMKRTGHYLRKPSFWLIFLSLCMTAVYLLTMLLATSGRPVAALDDAYIHFQYARQMALGKPWQYNSGDPVSTGATSLLYPFLLAAAYLLGFQGELIVWPALIIGAAGLILSSLFIYRITARLLGAGQLAREAIAFGTALLFLFSGAVTVAYFNGMETGLFTVLVLAALYGFVRDRPSQTAVFLALSGLVRPEGLFLAGVAWLIYGGQIVLGERQEKRPLLFMTLAVLVAGFPYLLNLALSGTPTASGAQAKSWLGNVPFVFSDIVFNIGRMLGLILGRMSLGLFAEKSWPVAPGILPLALFGGWVLWRRGERWTVLLVLGWFSAGCLLTATLITALWHIGRYQVPFLAILLPFCGVAAGFLWQRVSGRWQPALAAGLLLGLILVLVTSYEGRRSFDDAVASTLGQQIALADWIDLNLPEDTLVTVHDAGAIRYVGRRPIYDMIGLTTQGAAAAWRHGSGAIFELMEEAAPRPAYFATYPDVATIPYFAETALFSRELFQTEPYGRRTASTASPVQAVYEIDWGPAAGGGDIHQADILDQVAGLDFIGDIDLANLRDEEQKGLRWTVGRTQPGFPTEVRQFTYRTDPQMELLDGGRLVSGSLSFPLAVTADQPLLLAARLHAPEAGAVDVIVDGRSAGTWRYPAAPGQWLEISFLIPAALIGAPEVEIELALQDPEGQAEPLQIYHLWAFQGEQQSATVTPQQTAGVRFGEHIWLEGYDLPLRTLKAGDDLALTLYWRSDIRLDQDAKLFLHLYDSDGNLVAQVDQRPYHDTRPPFTWLPDAVLRDPVTLAIPDDLAPGVYDLALGLYDPQSSERLPVLVREGEIAADARWFLPQIVIEE